MASIRFSLAAEPVLSVMDEAADAKEFPGRRYVWIDLTDSDGSTLTISWGLASDERIVAGTQALMDVLGPMRAAAEARIAGKASALLTPA